VIEPAPDAEAAELTSLAVSVATAAGELLLGYYDGAAPNDELAASVRSKSTRTDLVTAADHASEALVVDRLLDARPDDGILAEEGSARPDRSGVTWVIDPLDGTINFVYGFPQFAVSIGCQIDGRTVAGVVHDPIRGETFTATEGHGARLGDQRLQLGRDGAPLAEALVATGFGYDADRRRHQARLLTTVLPEVRDIRRAGSAALDLCWVAAGRLDACYEAGLAPWDLVAGALVVTEAGGVVELLEGIVQGASTVVAGPERLQRDLVSLVRRAAGAAASGGPAAASSPAEPAEPSGPGLPVG
jgi:fructose-1,6-bisphosphatase/inositol monophosphatase family enzyme